MRAKYGLALGARARTAALGFATLLVLVLASAANAETYHASTTAQFAEAVSKANANPGANTIVLAAGIYVPEATVTLTNTSGTQTISGATTFPASKIEGGNIEPFPSELLVIKTGVTAVLKNVLITTGGGNGVPSIDNFGTLTIESSLVSGNNGPGMHVEPGSTATVRNTTFAEGLDFGIIDNGTASLINSTVARNELGGVENKNTLKLTNTIVANNKGAGDCVGKANTSDLSLDSNGSCGVAPPFSGVNPMLGPLANNGGPTPTFALEAGSPAIDAADKTACPTTDQRGFPRPDVPTTACDIGAFEFYAPPHYYINGTGAGNLLTEGVKIPTLSWGTLTLTPGSPSKEGTTSCENGAGGFIENPTGGGAGVGQASVFLSWNCAKPTSCPNGSEIEFPPASGKKVTIEADIFPGGELGTPEQNVLGESFPWPILLTRSEAAKIRQETKGVVEILGCAVKKSVEGSGALGDGDGDTPQFVKKLTVCFTNELAGAKQEPLAENGTQVGGPLTSKLNWNPAGSGHVLCKGEGEGGAEIEFTGAVTGSIKTFTYEGQEVVDAH